MFPRGARPHPGIRLFPEPRRHQGGRGEAEVARDGEGLLPRARHCRLGRVRHGPGALAGRPLRQKRHRPILVRIESSGEVEVSLVIRLAWTWLVAKRTTRIIRYKKHPIRNIVKISGSLSNTN